MSLTLAFVSAGARVRAQQKAVAEPVARTTISMLDSTREQDGLTGPVRRVHTEMAKLSVDTGRVAEEPRMLLEVTTYDPQGKRIWNVYYPVSTGSFKGNQAFAYNDQGHVKEMTLRDDAGRVLSREAYTYEFDRFGNWTKMTSSLVIFDGGKLIHEPLERTYRAISYYFDDSVAQIVKSSSAPAEASSARKEPDRNEVKPAMRVVEVLAGTNAQAYQIPAPVTAAPPAKKPAVSSGVLDGKILNLPKPVYPKVAVERGIFGKVIVEVTIDELGRVVEARVVSGNPLLEVSAVTAARMARFEPTLLSGQPVKATRLIDYNFRKR